jgi:hypothetical protein
MLLDRKRFEPAALVILLLIGGCREIETISSGLNQQTEPTHWIWARLQGIQIREFPQVRSELESIETAAAAFDVDQMSDIFGRVAETHARIADLLAGLDEEKVDEVALAYRDRLEKSHRDLANAYRDYAASVKDRDAAAIASAKTQLPALTQALATVWSERTGVMAELQERYSRDFDVID